MIETWNERYCSEVIDLWNKEAVKDGYKEMTEEDFSRIFTDHASFDPTCTFVWLEAGRVTGFACGCTGDELPLGDIAGYITCIVVNLGSASAKQDRYTGLLEALEVRFLELGKRQAEMLFFNPMPLPWYIPNTERHEHNNAPGVPVDSGLHTFLIQEGYAERATQCAMYLKLGAFEVPESMIAKEEKAAADGYTVELLDMAKHTSVADMLETLGNPLWKREIGSSAESGTPVVIAAHEGKAVGFAGPVIRQPNGRGYFAGIGVMPQHEGHGLGSSLFFRLCEAFQNMGTDYMSLYTGSSNPAIRIYEKAGFQTVKTFAIMRKELA
ncbi:GNAT family N-acetyltransferase [Paenibacillus paeoniae]|uniref:GNAT family N-acetyltransferase n=1 Tax=Paenibacillus paeoniae TaxID=2292705 RepID=A0A371P756_9BACL|nr:GNAT family N-acetyltransferase [Paenibacillus paeoniae]REK71772.1 GNAT family N-acetyltransferase [Paenibacillus paeoniae]